MLKHSICGLVLVGLVTSAAPAIDIVWEPTVLEIGVPTIVSIYIQTNEDELRYGGGRFGLNNPGTDTPLGSATPDGVLFYDLDGPDNTPFTGDDGWVWQNGLDGGLFISLINDPSTALVAPNISNFIIPANDRMLVATLLLTGTELGDKRLVPIMEHVDDNDFTNFDIKEGAVPVFTVIPEPAKGSNTISPGSVKASMK